MRLLQTKPYVYERHILPHDAKVKELGSGRSRIETLHSLGVRPTWVCRQHSVADGINAVRLVLARAWFDAERCGKGIRALRGYRRQWNEDAQAWRASPVHDHASHGADAARYLSLGVRGEDGAAAVVKVAEPLQTGQWADRKSATSWMSV